MRLSLYARFVEQLERDAPTLADLPPKEQRAFLVARFEAQAHDWLSEKYAYPYMERQFRRAMNHVMGWTKARRQRAQDRRAALFIHEAK